MARLVGLALASKLTGNSRARRPLRLFSDRGNEIVFGTIGNASCAEGIFWEAVNAIGVLQAPMLLAIWDDGYGISVPNELQCEADIWISWRFSNRPDGNPASRSTKPAAGLPQLCGTFLEASGPVRLKTRLPSFTSRTDAAAGAFDSGSHEPLQTRRTHQVGARV